MLPTFNIKYNVRTSINYLTRQSGTLKEKDSKIGGKRETGDGWMGRSDIRVVMNEISDQAGKK